MATTERDFNAAVGRQIRTRRVKCGLTQDRLGDEVDLARTSITNIESGNQPVSGWLLWQLAETLGCEVCDLLPARSDLHPRVERLPDDLTPRTADVARRLAADQAFR